MTLIQRSYVDIGDDLANGWKRLSFEHALFDQRLCIPLVVSSYSRMLNSRSGNSNSNQ